MLTSVHVRARHLSGARVAASLALLLLLLLGCGGGGGGSAPRATTLPPPRGSTAMGAVPSPTTAPAPLTVAVAPGAEVVFVDDLAGAGLFQDEEEQARLLLTAWAQDKQLRVVDAARTNEVLGRASRGEDARTGAACGRPLDSSEARDRWALAELGARDTLFTEIACEEQGEACMLLATVADPAGKMLAQWSAPFDVRAPWAEGLRRALAATVRTTEDKRSSIFGLLSGEPLNGSVKARPEKLSLFTRAARESDPSVEDALSLKGGMTPLRACVTETETLELLVAVDGTGRVSRCESHGASDPAARCACAVMRGAVAKRAARNLRLIAEIIYRPADVVARGKAVIGASVQTYLETRGGEGSEGEWKASVSDPSIKWWREPRGAVIASCFAELSPGAKLHFGMRTMFDDKGRATAAQFAGARGPSPSPAQLACVEHAFLASRAPCPASPAPRANAEITVVARPLPAR